MKYQERHSQVILTEKQTELLSYSISQREVQQKFPNQIKFIDTFSSIFSLSFFAGCQFSLKLHPIASQTFSLRRQNDRQFQLNQHFPMTREQLKGVLESRKSKEEGEEWNKWKRKTRKFERNRLHYDHDHGTRNRLQAVCWAKRKWSRRQNSKQVFDCLSMILHLITCSFGETLPSTLINCYIRLTMYKLSAEVAVK